MYRNTYIREDDARSPLSPTGRILDDEAPTSVETDTIRLGVKRYDCSEGISSPRLVHAVRNEGWAWRLPSS
jgi:hypothetical protein